MSNKILENPIISSIKDNFLNLSENLAINPEQTFCFDIVLSNKKEAGQKENFGYNYWYPVISKKIFSYEDFDEDSALVFLMNSQGYTRQSYFEYLRNFPDKFNLDDFSEKAFPSKDFKTSLANEILFGEEFDEIVFLIKMTLKEAIDMKNSLENNQTICIPKTTHCGLCDIHIGHCSNMNIILDFDVFLSKQNVQSILLDNNIDYPLHEFYGLSDDSFWEARKN